ncbi:MAG TPA: peptide-methionine (R)-S-oxide reductase MsrB [Spirochaetia bacterium]|nr:peptide-methionine (R)-S-oxide reductase MsrB [Spirochaetia bacterium]
MADKLRLDESEWKKRLTPEQYQVLRKKATERPWTGELNDFKGDGVFLCAACGQELFDAQTKFDSGSGWPSFWRPIDPNAIEEESDGSLFMKRTEVVCSRCGSHLGHVFPDGPKPTGLRYCINSISLSVRKGEGKKKADTAN